ncbi:hypothetical protein FRUB_04324 [Fimbriiglobus ruber]|uniref:Uncharacterized protein n=1 Tax=Fimbriiglobus ruber TaxID=1908690 RepID=A0A225DX31_9BACT|nr:hypothetical protein FRUB_04324 [Fimbriiglobus ruber]
MIHIRYGGVPEFAMPDTPVDRVGFDELHVTLLVPRDLSATAVE